MRPTFVAALLSLALASTSGCGSGHAASPRAYPVPDGARAVFPYREMGGVPLLAYVFGPAQRSGGGAPAQADSTNAILLFHGGGWVAGSAQWTFEAARRFAGAGLVAIAVDYRLCDAQVTPVQELDDVCAAFAWARAHGAELGITGRVAGYGVSAGGHLVAAAATVGCGEGVAGPDALLLWSPALDVERDGWFVRLLQGRAQAADYSPVTHVRASTPPTCIVVGDKDTLTPLAGAQRFHDLVVAAGGTSELNVHPGLGHLLTRNLANQESDFDPDPTAVAKGIHQHMEFLKQLGFIGAGG